MNAAFSQGVYPMSNGNVACTHINIYTVLYTLVQKWFNLLIKWYVVHCELVLILWQDDTGTALWKFSGDHLPSTDAVVNLNESNIAQLVFDSSTELGQGVGKVSKGFNVTYKMLSKYQLFVYTGTVNLYMYYSQSAFSLIISSYTFWQFYSVSSKRRWQLL